MEPQARNDLPRRLQALPGAGRLSAKMPQPGRQGAHCFCERRLDPLLEDLAHQRGDIDVRDGNLATIQKVGGQNTELRMQRPIRRPIEASEDADQGLTGWLIHAAPSREPHVPNQSLSRLELIAHMGLGLEYVRLHGQ